MPKVPKCDVVTKEDIDSSSEGSIINYRQRGIITK